MLLSHVHQSAPKKGTSKSTSDNAQVTSLINTARFGQHILKSPKPANGMQRYAPVSRCIYARIVDVVRFSEMNDLEAHCSLR